MSLLEMRDGRKREKMSADRLRCHNMRNKRAAGHGEGSPRQRDDKQTVVQRSHKENTGVINCKQVEEGGREGGFRETHA